MAIHESAPIVQPALEVNLPSFNKVEFPEEVKTLPVPLERRRFGFIAHDKDDIKRIE
jgi:hypothetical protein